MSTTDRSPGRAKSEAHLSDVSAILQKLKDEVAYLQDQVEAKGSGFYGPLCDQVLNTESSIRTLGAVLHACTDGLDNKDPDGIPESGSSCPCPVRDSTDQSVADERDFGKAIRLLQRSTNKCRAAYQAAACAAKHLVEDADKLDIVVKACQTEYIKLKLLNNNAKAYVNAKRLKWQRQAHSFRYWAEFVHFETIGAIQREMEDLVSEQEQKMIELEAELARATAAFDAQMSGQRRIKCLMLLKKMRNSRLQSAFATWDDYIQQIRWERMEAEKAALMAELQARFGHLSAEEIERKLRQFLKRWINRKMIGPFRSWKGLIEEKRQAEMDALLAAERARLAAELAAMQDNHAIKMLKMHFARIAGLAKQMTFRALMVYARQSRARKLLDSEAGKRLKAFLASKLAGTLRKCYTAIIRNHDGIAAENIKNNDKAKKVGLLLEKLARGLVHRQFSALVRYWNEAGEERAAQAAIDARMAALSEANRAKLRVFLMNKERQQLMMFFKQWLEVAQCKGLLELYELLDKEEAGRRAAEDELAALLAASGSAGAAAKGIEDQSKEEQDALHALNNKLKGLQSELRRIHKQIQNTEGDLESENAQRAEVQERNAEIRGQLEVVTAARDELANELMGVAQGVHEVHGEAQYE
eukprot:TRINITY_DN6659_c0_g1_i1.p2 TRINITY_DN6659_c0_g1~~TRINITY_DN6659_c0_g1_i1.p2  ORF type:complete len:642 (+),score=238.32 TRINITY_DN6659_c0_g1_i1:192-2117(+)